jgi:hypothetical protein
LVVLLGACSSYGPGGLASGASVASVTARMGAPTGEYPLPDGGRRLEFARGPFGKHTYMLDFDAAGQLVRSEQVLTQAHFDAIRPGMTAAEVLSQIGRPSTTWPLARQRQTVWAYRYDAPFCVWFMIGMGYDDKVIDAIYGPDPMCEVNEPDLGAGTRR